MWTSWRAPDPQPRGPRLCQQGHPSSAARAGAGTRGCFPDPSSRTKQPTFPHSSSDPGPREEGTILCGQSVAIRLKPGLATPAEGLGQPCQAQGAPSRAPAPCQPSCAVPCHTVLCRAVPCHLRPGVLPITSCPTCWGLWGPGRTTNGTSVSLRETMLALCKCRS